MMGTRLAVVLGGLFISVSTIALAQDKQPAAALELLQEFDGFISKFRAPLKNNDAAAIAAMTRLPFQGDDAVKDATQFREKVYEPEFTPQTRTCLAREKAVYDRDGENSDNFLIFCDQQIFVFTRTAAGFQFTDIGMND